MVQLSVNIKRSNLSVSEIKPGFSKKINNYFYSQRFRVRKLNIVVFVYSMYSYPKYV